METQPSNPSSELPTSTKNVVEIIERRVKTSARFHLSSVHTWNQSGTSLLTLDIIDGDVAIYIIARVIERSLHSGKLMFQGIEYSYLHSKVMTESMEKSLLATHGHMIFFIHDLPRLIERMLERFLKHHHLIVRGDALTPRISASTQIDKQRYAYTSTTLH